jgi:hypothetical protein
MGLIRLLKTLVIPRPVPRLGDPVWWAPMRLGCQITEVRGPEVIFQGGELVTNTQGRQVPRWTVMTTVEHMTFDPGISMWIVGQGEVPKDIRGQVVRPTPVVLSAATGSFAKGT